MSAVTRDHKPCGFKHKNWSSQLWRLDVQNQGGGRATLALEALGEHPPCLPVSWLLLAFLVAALLRLSLHAVPSVLAASSPPWPLVGTLVIGVRVY